MPEEKEGYNDNHMQAFCCPLLFIPEEHSYLVPVQCHTTHLIKAHLFPAALERFGGCPTVDGAHWSPALLTNGCCTPVIGSHGTRLRP